MSDVKCPKCGQPLRVVAKNVRTGEVLYSCRTQGCHYTVWIDESVKCPKCGKEV
jgi:ssDNA-binding Zn-finger/Zn-ribbon topoisomerase 1